VWKGNKWRGVGYKVDEWIEEGQWKKWRKKAFRRKEGRLKLTIIPT
jgi:hypothetical protein